MLLMVCAQAQTITTKPGTTPASNTAAKPKPTECWFVSLVTDLDHVPEKNATVVIKSEDKTITRQGITDIDGKFVAIVPKGKKYNVTVTKSSYDFKFVANVPKTAGEFEFVQNYVINLFLDFKRSYLLNNVFFEPNKYDVKDTIKPALDSLAQVFKTNTRFRAEIAGYTDNVGNDTDNMRLSQRRADAIRDYLIAQGVPSHRVQAKGYGKKFPVTSNDNDIGRARNRRIEVKVIQE
jgi:OOP family OmpA-OmpF porin